MVRWRGLELSRRYLANYGPRRYFSKGIDPQEQLANLGRTVDRIETAIPHLLYEPFAYDLVHPAITLKLFPEINAVDVHGQNSYRVSIKLLQLWATTLMVPPDTQLVPLSISLSRESHVPDRRLQVHWRTVPPEKNRRPPSIIPTTFGEGNLLKQLDLLPDEYPIIVGSFDFEFPESCDSILVHTIRNVEYLARPVAEPAS